jgi:hypothetical protein
MRWRRSWHGRGINGNRIDLSTTGNSEGRASYKAWRGAGSGGDVSLSGKTSRTVATWRPVVLLLQRRQHARNAITSALDGRI